MNDDFRATMDDFWGTKKKKYRPEKGIVLEYNRNPKLETEYQINLDSRQWVRAGQEEKGLGHAEVEISVRQEIQEVRENRDTLIRVEITGGRMRHNGVVYGPLEGAGQEFEFLMQKNGKILQSTLDFDYQLPTLPEHAIRVGDAWESIMEKVFPFQDPATREPHECKESLEFFSKFTEVEEDESFGIQVAVIEMRCDKEPFELAEGVTLSLRTEGKSRFGFVDGVLVQSVVKSTTEVSAPELHVFTEIHSTIQLRPANL